MTGGSEQGGRTDREEVRSISRGQALQKPMGCGQEKVNAAGLTGILRQACLPAEP